MLLAGLGWAAPALAHLHLESSEPASGSQVSETPAAVKLDFAEDVKAQAGTAVLYGADGTKVETPDPEQGSSGDEVLLPLPPGLAAGTYTVKWKATGADGHPKSGTVSFSLVRGDVAAASVDPAAVVVPADDAAAGPPAVVGWLLRWGGFSASLLAMGAVVFLCWVHDGLPGDRPRLARVASVSAWTGAAVVALQFLVFGLTAGFGAALDSTFAWGAALALFGLGLAGLGSPALAHTQVGVMALAGAGVTLASFLFTGHAASSDPWWLVVPATLVHTGAAAVWFGGLVCLFLAIGYRPRTARSALDGAHMVARFSRIAAWALAAAAAGGVVFAAVQLGSPLELVTSAYGWVLLVKLTLVGLVLLVARYNREVLVPRIDQRDAPKAWLRLGRTVRTEALGLVLALAVTATLVGMAPPRS